MNSTVVRRGRRHPDQLREIKASFNLFGYASGSVLFEVGKTKVLCSVNLQSGVPPFLKGKKRGWLTAEYAMLPSSTALRTNRESSTMRRSGRNMEISRFIGRSLRSIVDFDLVGERTIVVDCDVLQADGGTRTACITGACLALRVAVNRWLKQGIISDNILRDAIVAVSVGIIDGQPFLDLDFSEDSRADADFNIVVTQSKKVVEIQGASEGELISWCEFEQARAMAATGIEKIFRIIEKFIQRPLGGESKKEPASKSSSALFSLQNRQNSTSA